MPLTDSAVLARLALYWRTRLTHESLSPILAKSPRQTASLMKDWFGGREGRHGSVVDRLVPALEGLDVHARFGHRLPDQMIGEHAALFPEAADGRVVPGVLDMLTIGAALQRMRCFAGMEGCDSFAPFGLPVEDVGLLENGHEQRALHVLCAAGARRSTVDMVYVAKNGQHHYEFSPVRIVRLGDRVRVRGYAQSLDDLPVYGQFVQAGYIDLVPSRMVWPPEITGRPLQRAPEGDTEWEEWGQVEALFCPSLTAKELLALQEEYADQLNEAGDGIVIAPQRAAIAFYTKRALAARRIDHARPVFLGESCRFVADSR